ncbi:MAG: hypothetical protein O6831_02655, partial [Alphaproteobacteria bacterium]|nr:hypothetical protein [Alphaproteobacteria bacterium]
TRLRKTCEGILQSHGRRVVLIANYDAFDLRPDVSGLYFNMVAALERKYFVAAARYATSTFTRFKLEAALERRGLVPNIFSARHEAMAFIRAPFKELAKGGSLALHPDDGNRPPLGARRLGAHPKGNNSARVQG